jgi:hypothetical protein
MGGEGSFEYRFTQTQADPHEQHPLQRWKFADLRNTVGDEYGDEAEEWMEEAMGWFDDGLLIWSY